MGGKPPDAENAVRYLRDNFFNGMMTFKEAELMKPLLRGATDLIKLCGITIVLNVKAPDLIIDVVEGESVLYHAEAPMRVPGITEFRALDIGCCTMPDGRRLVSVAFVEGESRDAHKPYIAMAFEVNNSGEFRMVQYDDWQDTWPIDFVTVDKEAGGFVPTLEKSATEPLVAAGEQVDTYDAHGIHCSLHSLGDRLALELSKDEQVLKRVTFSKHTPVRELYTIDDLGSGKTADGKVCLSLSVIEDDNEADIPYYVLYAVEIDADGTVHECDYSSWSNGETDPYLVFDESAGGLVNFVGTY